MINPNIGNRIYHRDRGPKRIHPTNNRIPSNNSSPFHFKKIPQNISHPREEKIEH
jgi:hypothetical protein